MSSVNKKWKDRSFAAGVHRDEAQKAIEEFSGACFNGQLDLWQHVGNVLAAMQGIAGELELDGRGAKL